MKVCTESSNLSLSAKSFNHKSKRPSGRANLPAVSLFYRRVISYRHYHSLSVISRPVNPQKAVFGGIKSGIEYYSAEFYINGGCVPAVLVFMVDKDGLIAGVREQTKGGE
jgi:hypothetical protein